MDGSGTHGRGLFRRFVVNAFDVDIPLAVPPHPIVAATDLEFVRQAIFKQNGGVKGRLIDIVKRWLHR
jgi:hypothetical protein